MRKEREGLRRTERLREWRFRKKEREWRDRKKQREKDRERVRDWKKEEILEV